MALLLVSYDIPCDRRRHKVAKALEKYGRRIQFSVFLIEEYALPELARAIEPLLDLSADNVRLHPLCASCAGKALLLGSARHEIAPDGYVVL